MIRRVYEVIDTYTQVAVALGVDRITAKTIVHGALYGDPNAKLLMEISGVGW